MAAKAGNKGVFIPFIDEHTIVIDPGKNEVKVFDIKKGKIVHAFSFPSKIEHVSGYSGYESVSDKIFQFEYQGELYLVGEVVNGSYSYETTKVNVHHQMCIYTAIARLTEDGETVNLLVGFPSSDYKNQAKLREYQELIVGNGSEIETTLNGERHAFNIRHFSVHPEGTSLYTRKTEGDQAYHVIDIGGKNINYRFYERNGNSSNAYSLDKSGMNYLTDEMKEALRGVVNGDEIDIEAIDYDEVFKTKTIPNVDQIDGFDSVADFVDFHVDNFIATRIETLLAKDVNLKQKGHKIIFTGGGSIKLKSYLERRYESNQANLIFSKCAVFDNCASYLIMHLLDEVRAERISGEEGLRIYNDIKTQIKSKYFEERRQLAPSLASYQFTSER